MLLLVHRLFAAAVGKGWIEPGTLHLANLTGLQPSTTHWYRVVDLATGGTAATASEVASFTTPARVGTTETLTFVVGADLGTGNNDDGSEQPQYNPSVGAYAVVQVGAVCAAAGCPAALSSFMHAQGAAAADSGAVRKAALCCAVPFPAFLQGMNEVAAAVKARFGILVGDLSYSGGCCIPGNRCILPRSATCQHRPVPALAQRHCPADGTLYRWTQYTNQAAPLLTSIMTLTAQGNHEVGPASSQQPAAEADWMSRVQGWQDNQMHRRKAGWVVYPQPFQL